MYPYDLEGGISLALGRLKQEGDEFKSSLGFKVKSYFFFKKNVTLNVFRLQIVQPVVINTETYPSLSD